MRRAALLAVFAIVGCASEPTPPPPTPPPAPAPGGGVNVEDDYTSKFKQVSESAKPMEADLNVALEEADYATALQVVEKVERHWKDAGFATVYLQQRLEALLGLKQYEELIKAAGPTREPGETMSSTATALALLRTGKEAEARKMYADQFILQHLPPLSRRVLPPTKSKKEFETALHAARGIEMYFAGKAPIAERELEAAEALTPKQPLVNYFLGKLMLHQGEHSRARMHLKVASSLPGSLGLEAKQLSQ